MSEKKLAIKGSTLKWIAIITMLIDHTGATIVQGMLVTVSADDYQFWNVLYWVMRTIGRLAFPIFCYLLVEGIKHTSNPTKYAIRLLVFAFISDMPFDYAFFGGWVVWAHQNVFFTLFIGLIAVECGRFLEEWCNNSMLKYVMIAVSTFAFMVGADFLHTDYGSMGVLTIVLIYYFPRILPERRKGFGFLLALLPLILTNIFEAPALLDALVIRKYDGTRGRQMKYFFYLFYPVHLLILGLLFHHFFKINFMTM